MKNPRSPHLTAILQALFVTFLWSTSWVLIKIGLEDIPALTFAGLRYTLAFLVLLPIYLRSPRATPLRALSRRDWVGLITLGLVYYSLTQGTQFLALVYLPAITLSLLLNFTSLIVAFLGIPFLNERPHALQWLGTAVFLAGVGLYFYPAAIPAAQVAGYLIAAVNVLATSGASLLGRYANRSGRLHPLTVTVVSMGVGSLALLAGGLLAEPFPRLDLRAWGIIAWLAVVNTALAFTLWNLTLRSLTAVESSIINNTMLIQIAVLAWLFLGERIGWVEGVGLALATVGAALVQLRRRARARQGAPVGGGERVK